MNENYLTLQEIETNEDIFYPYSRLYSAILDQAFSDLISKSNRTEDKLAKIDSINFFFDKRCEDYLCSIIFYSQYQINMTTMRKNIMKYLKKKDMETYNFIYEKFKKYYSFLF